MLILVAFPPVENWKSIFLQMSACVVLTAMLFSAGRPCPAILTIPIVRTTRSLPPCAGGVTSLLALRLLAGDCVGRAVRHLVRTALVGKFYGGDEEALRHGSELQPLLTFLLTQNSGSRRSRTGSRSLCRRPCMSFCRFPPPQGLAGIEAGRRRDRRNQRLIRQCRHSARKRRTPNDSENGRGYAR